MHDIYVYGTIGEDWGECTTAKEFASQMKLAGDGPVTIHINSCGGSVWDASAMADTISAHKGAVTARIEGLAASAASYFALTADSVTMADTALLMVHNPSCGAFGEASDLRKTADLLDKVRGTIVSRYVGKTGLNEAEVGTLMDDETWFTADEAMELGFVDEVEEMPAVTNQVDPAVSASWSKRPEGLVGERSVKPADAAPGPAARPTGEPASTIQPKARAERTVCVNGKFLTFRDTDSKE